MDYNFLAELLYPNVKETPDDIEAKYPPRNLPEGAVVSRHAPSPTGFVHLGNIVQSLISERMAHQSGGVMFLRIEDTDAKREVKGSVESLINMLGYYGIEFDEGVTVNGDKGNYGPYRQRKREDIYHVYAKELVKKGMAYPCFCTADEITAIHEQQETLKTNYGYYGKWAVWRDRPVEDIQKALDEGKPWVLRFRSEGNCERKIKFTDLIKGTLELTENDIDFVIIKSDGIPPYAFAHAVDDHLMHTTHVVRGDEWLPTLPFHLQLFAALGFKVPKYIHIGPLMKMDGTSKRKLSKRKDPELALTYYKAQGFPTESVLEYIMTVLNSNFEDWRRANPNADINSFVFSYKKLNPAGSLFDFAKLNNISKTVISTMSAEKVYQYLIEWAEEFDNEFYNLLVKDENRTKAILTIGRGGKKPRKDFGTWSEVKDYMGFFYDEYFKIEADYPDNFKNSDIISALDKYKSIYSETDDQNEWFEKIKTITEELGFASDMKEYKLNPLAYAGNVGDVSMFLRLAVTGKFNSPDMYEVMKTLGKEALIKRIDKMIERLTK